MPETTLAPLPRTLESPPRTTGNPQADLPILIDWFWSAYRSFLEIFNYINAQVTNPDFNIAALPDPENTTLAQAQQTANEAYNLANSATNRLDGFISGVFETADADTGVVVTFNEAQPDNDYTVFVQAVNSVGGAPVEAHVVMEKAYSATQFSVIMFGIPGVGNTITWEWRLIRNT